MNILYIITRGDDIGGASVHLLDLAQGVQEKGHNVTILAGGKGLFVNEARKRGLRCISLSHLIRDIRLITDVRGLIEIVRWIREVQPDVVHLHSSKAGILGRLAARWAGVPAVFTVHGWAFTEGVSGRARLLYRCIEKLMAPLAARIITVSKYDKELALSSGVAEDSSLTVIHNGIPDIRSTCIRERGAVKLIMVARFDAQKNQRLLLKALASLKDCSWHMDFVGDGRLLEVSKEYASELGLTDRVSFLGVRMDVGKLISQADVLLLISNWEGFPLTILEGMRAGLPVIASRVGGVAEAVEDGVTGFLIGREDESGLVEAIRELVDNEALRLSFGKNGRERYEREFTFDRMLEKTVAVYHELGLQPSLGASIKGVKDRQTF